MALSLSYRPFTSSPSSLAGAYDSGDSEYFNEDNEDDSYSSEEGSPHPDGAIDPLPQSLQSSLIPGLGPGRRSSYSLRTLPYRLYCSTERRNTTITLTDPHGNALHRVTTGMVGYKKSARKGAEPALRAAFEMFSAIKNNERAYYRKTGLTMTHYELYFKGLGQGREGVQKAFMASEGAEVRRRVVKVVDTTRLKIGGVRPKKRMGEYNGSASVKISSTSLTGPLHVISFHSALNVPTRVQHFSFVGEIVNPICSDIKKQ